MKIDSEHFRVKPGKKVSLEDWPTVVKPFCKSKDEYEQVLDKHVEELSSLQDLHYASNRYALLLIFQGMDAAGKGWSHSARHVGRQSAGVPGFQLQAAQRRRTGA